jgi:hypothetical protein
VNRPPTILQRAALAAGVLTAAALIGSCAPADGDVESAAEAHAHSDHAHASVPEYAAHAHDANAASGVSNLELVDIDGVDHGTLSSPARGRWTSLFFVRTDCPVANQYAPEIGRICAEYAAEGVECLLVYVDGHLTPADVRRHTADFDLALPAILDRDHALVEQAGATITPEVALFAAGGALEYRGRIDNGYEELGRPRRVVTERDFRLALDDLVAGRAMRAPRTQATGCYIE